MALPTTLSGFAVGGTLGCSRDLLTSLLAGLYSSWTDSGRHALQTVNTGMGPQTKSADTLNEATKRTRLTDRGDPKSQSAITPPRDQHDPEPSTSQPEPAAPAEMSEARSDQPQVCSGLSAQQYIPLLLSALSMAWTGLACRCF